ncbi:hypothetical protein CMUST_01075 [Corynebacterium mustelae]|uniref:HTH cro/C1-type domain-containing protein n=1 Tax=Corynebacterium mustelae TaxID=571915 RepID=A0A0G3GVJ7_9CORY|nr:helix-turn-helix transcriptional regulator [Corynebacterium mustelae]AKK04565.1 hypothetical protein CMUST_01075 [Corynebacterium mustelae]
MNYLEIMPNELSCRSGQIAAEIRAELARQEKTVNDLADEVGMPISTARRSVKGQRPFNVDELFAVCGVLGLGMVELIERASNEQTTAA